MRWTAGAKLDSFFFLFFFFFGGFFPGNISFCSYYLRDDLSIIEWCFSSEPRKSAKRAPDEEDNRAKGTQGTHTLILHSESDRMCAIDP